MTILDTFYILFESDASKLDKGLSDAEGKAEGLVDKLGGVDKAGSKAGASLLELASKTAGLLGLGMSVGALVTGIRDTAQAFDDLSKTAARLRDSADAVDEFVDAAGLLGITEETATDALKSFDSAMQDVFLGMGRSKKVFEDLGLSVTDAEGKLKPTTVAMGELADKMKGMEKGTQIRIMEKLGLDPSLLKVFNSDFVDLQRRMADIDNAAGANMERALKRSNEFMKASKGLSLEVKTLTLYLNTMVEELKLAALPYFTQGMEIATKYAKMFVDFLLRHSKLVEGVMIAIGAAIAYFLIPAAINGAIAVWAMIAPFVAVGAAVLAAIAVFALLYDDIMNFAEGNESAIGRLVAKWPAVGEVIKGLAAEFKFVESVAKALWRFLTGMFDDPEAAFEQFKADLMAGLNELVDTFPGLRQAVDDVEAAFNTAANAIQSAWDAVIATIKGAISAVLDGVQAVSDAYSKARAFAGLAPSASVDNLNVALAEGRKQLSSASSSPLASQTSGSIRNSAMTRNTTVQVDKIEIQTQATDAQGVSKAIGQSMQSQMRQAVSNYDDGVLA